MYPVLWATLYLDLFLAEAPLSMLTRTLPPGDSVGCAVIEKISGSSRQAVHANGDETEFKQLKNIDETKEMDNVDNVSSSISSENSMANRTDRLINFYIKTIYN